jgi:2-amino-4-hydroxy-6-hydroxymethyldihydropteridine diphosphokinase
LSEAGIRKQQTNMHQAFLGLGSNIDPELNLPRAVKLLQKWTEVEAVSLVWETPPAGTFGPNFLNAAILVRTPLPPGLLKHIILRPIEIQMGRIRTANKNAPRPIDLDILVCDGQTIDAKLWTLAFNAVPLAELFPDYRNPVTGETLREVARRLSQDTPLKLRMDVNLFASIKSP